MMAFLINHRNLMKYVILLYTVNTKCVYEFIFDLEYEKTR